MLFKGDRPVLRVGREAAAMERRPRQRWLLFLSAGLAIALVVSVAAFVDEADARKKLRNFTRADSAAQSGNIGFLVEEASINHPNDPFFFSNSRKVRRINQISITATIFGGDTGPGNIDENQLTLVLDGIDTGILLNGYTSGQTVTQTNTGAPNNAGQIVAALRADGQLNATINDADPGDNGVTIPDDFEATLQIKGKQRR